eukprot:1378684-Amorphochlora_amoeboformis.AAC.1
MAGFLIHLDSSPGGWFCCFGGGKKPEKVEQRKRWGATVTTLKSDKSRRGTLMTHFIAKQQTMSNLEEESMGRLQLRSGSIKSSVSGAAFPIKELKSGPIGGGLHSIPNAAPEDGFAQRTESPASNTPAKPSDSPVTSRQDSKHGEIDQRLSKSTLSKMEQPYNERVRGHPFHKESATSQRTSATKPEFMKENRTPPNVGDSQTRPQKINDNDKPDAKIRAARKPKKVLSRQLRVEVNSKLD